LRTDLASRHRGCSFDRLLTLRLTHCRPAPDGEQLEAVARQLLGACQAGLAEPVSYNAIMTQEFMMMVPRSSEMAGPCAVK